MRKSTYVLLAALPFAAMIAVVRYNQRQTRRELDELRASVQSAAESRESVSSSQPIQRADEIGRMLARAAIAASAKGAPTEPVPAEHAEEPAKVPQKRLSQEQVTETVLAAFAKEAKDPEWSRLALEKIDGAIRQELPPGSRIRSTDCRTTMCVVEIEHQDAATAQSWLLPGLRDWPGSVYIPGQREEGGTLVQTIVPMKEGASPPYAGL